MIPSDIHHIRSSDPAWYRKIWSLDIHDMAWTEQTRAQMDFLWDVLHLKGGERILDLACGFGRHALELARRGCTVVGVDITPAYVAEGNHQARVEGLAAEFICADIREIHYSAEFDIVLNLADGAIGYLEDDAENLKIFDRVAVALKPGGLHLMDICNGGYAACYFPARHWMFGCQSLSLADFDWDPQHKLMYYGGLDFKYGEPLERPEAIYSNPTRLYSLPELNEIMAERGMRITRAYGDFNVEAQATDQVLQIQVVSQKDR